MTAAPPLPRRRLGRAARHGDGPAGLARRRDPARRARDRRRAVGDADDPRRRPAMRREAAPELPGAVRARGAAALPAPLAGDARDDGHQPVRHLHDEVQPARQRGDRRGSDRRPASAPGRRDAAGRCSRSSTASSCSCASCRGWTGSCSRPAAAPTRPTCTPASPARITPRAASWRSATRSSPRSRPIPATRRPRQRRASR